MGGEAVAERKAQPERSLGSDSAKSTAELLQRCPGRCPLGHELTPWIAKQGHCDGCGRMVATGRRVMDCRQCNWYLCESCLPQEEAVYDGSWWGALSYMVDTATQEMSEMADDIAALVPSISCMTPEKATLAVDEIEVVGPMGGRHDWRQGGPAEDAVPREVRHAGSPAEAPGTEVAPTPAPPAQAQAQAPVPAPAPATAEPPQAAKQQPPEDLMTFQEDLLDLRQELPAAAPAAVTVPEESRATVASEEPFAGLADSAGPPAAAPSVANSSDPTLQAPIDFLDLSAPPPDSLMAAFRLAPPTGQREQETSVNVLDLSEPLAMSSATAPTRTTWTPQETFAGPDLPGPPLVVASSAPAASVAQSATADLLDLAVPPSTANTAATSVPLLDKPPMASTSLVAPLPAATPQASNQAESLGLALGEPQVLVAAVAA